MTEEYDENEGQDWGRFDYLTDPYELAERRGYLAGRSC